ncbi:MAG: WYL domain-containing protein [Cyanobacteria bacterium]|nr:WYL domain-containing protein [Cyanobacteriota bacterium]
MPNNIALKVSLGDDFEANNICVSAYRVMFLLQRLVQYQALGIPDINTALEENPLIGRSFNNETITKYMNTLRYLGCCIPRASNANRFSYQLLQNPFPLQLNEEAWQTLLQLGKQMSEDPDERFYQQLLQFLARVAWYLSPRHQSDVALIQQASENFTNPLLRQQRQLMRQYQSLCRQGQVLEIDYWVEGATPVALMVEPRQVVIVARQLQLVGLDWSTQEEVRLNIEKIRRCRQLPFRAQKAGRRRSVIFQVSGRLARNYRPYPDETVEPVSLASDGSVACLRVKHKTDDVGALLNRLMKYGPLCEVLSPASARGEMSKRVAILWARLNTE